MRLKNCLARIRSNQCSCQRLHQTDLQVCVPTVTYFGDGEPSSLHNDSFSSRIRTDSIQKRLMTTTSSSMGQVRERQFSKTNLMGSSSLVIAGKPQILHHMNKDHMEISKRYKVFVSKHNNLNVTSNMIQDFCASNGIPMDEMKTSVRHIIIKECPFCHPINNKADNMYKLYVEIGSGLYFCHRCGANGNWYDFKSKLSGWEVQDFSGGSDSGNEVSRSSSNTVRKSQDVKGLATRNLSNRCSPMPNPKLSSVYTTNLMSNPNPIILPSSDRDNHDGNNQMSALEYLLTVRGINKSTLRKYGVGRAVYSFYDHDTKEYKPAECITFPWTMRGSEIQEQENLLGNKYDWKDKNTENQKKDPWILRRVKVRALEKKSWQKLEPAGGGWGLFGWHTVPDDATEIIIAEGEYDAMAIYQATGRPAVSLPNGCRSLPTPIIPLLEKFEKIYLWMDNDGPGQEGAEVFSKKLGVGRVFIVQPDIADGDLTPKDANDALLKGLDLGSLLDKASVPPHDRILTFKELRSQVLHEILNPEQYVGVRSFSLPALSKIIKGFRRGEMTVLTGPTGSGKTTLLGQFSLDFAKQGVNVLWGSFEIKNTRLVHKLLQQFSGTPIPIGNPNSVQLIESIADEFQNLPMYFMKFHGGSEVDDVLDAMDYAVYVHDVEHIILDNLQFMLIRSGKNNVFDKYDQQDIAVEKFRKFATERNVHITLVVHPRKELEGAKLGISSIYGSAKATQEADLVLILQDEGDKKKYVEVKKNRFDGTLGTCPLRFDRKTGSYIDASDTNDNGNSSDDSTPPSNGTPAPGTSNKNGGKEQKSALDVFSDNLDYEEIDLGPHEYHGAKKEDS